jgi:predicted ATP-grasp superfamily ATP-dependent carboligase
MAEQPAVLVLDGEQRAALAVTRSLGRQGCAVHVGSSVARSLAGGSRQAASETAQPDPLNSGAAYARAVAALAHQVGATVVIPAAEPSTLALLEHRTLLGETVLPTSDLEHFRRASDKESVLALAATLGIDVPRQWRVSGDPLEHRAIPDGEFPLVVKPARSVAGAEGSRQKVGVRYAHSRRQLDEAVAELGPAAGPFLLQAKAEGPGLGIFLLRWNGQLLASFAHRRIREKPPSGGVSVCCESVAAPAGLLQRSVALLEALDWNGVAMIEFKRDRRTQRDYLMEINPRFWGSLQLAIDAGVDFPWLLLQAALGRPAAAVMTWTPGRRSRWWWGEIDHLIARVRHSRAALELPADAPGVAATAAQVLLPWRPGQRSDVFRLSDPAPGWRESIAWIRALTS